MYVICMHVRPSFLLAYVKRTSTDVLSCATLYNVITMLSGVVGKLGRGKKKARGG